MENKSIQHICLSAVLGLLFLAGCRAPAASTSAVPTAPTALERSPTSAAEASPLPPAASDAPPEALAQLPFAQFLDESYTRLLQRDPEKLVELGLDDQLGPGEPLLTDISPAYVQATWALEDEVLQALLAYDRQALAPEEQLSYDVYRWMLEERAARRPYELYPYPVTYFITAVQVQTIFFFTDIHPLEDVQDAQDYVARLEQVYGKITQLVENLERQRQAGIIAPRMLLEYSLRDIRGVSQAAVRQTPFYQTLASKLGENPVFSDADRQELLQSAELAVNRFVQPAFQALEAAVLELIPQAPTEVGVWQFPEGEAYYNLELRRHTTTDLTADQIHELGLAEVARLQAELQAVFAQLGYPAEASLAENFARVRQDGGSLRGQELVAGYESLIREAEGQMPDWFDRLPGAPVVVIGGQTGGFYVAPAVDGSRPGAFYAAVQGTEPRYSMASLAYHEAVPGHHTQSALAQELDLPIMRRDAFFTGYIEGWALYGEQLAAEMGLYADNPYGEVGRLQFELFRAARLVVDTGMHARRWSFDEAVAYFEANTGYRSGQGSLDPHFEVARYVAWPGQATAYKIGMLKIVELRQQAQERLGERFDIREFHNVVLTHGPLPLELLERVVEAYIQQALES